MSKRHEYVGPEDLITLKQAEELGYGKADTLHKQIVRYKTLKGLKYGTTWVVNKNDLKK